MDTLAKLPRGSVDATPFDIINAVRHHVNNKKATSHTSLLTAARLIKLHPGDDPSQYFEAHESLRTRMMNAGFPNIEKEATTIHFMINGIIDNPQYGLLATIIEQAPPTSIQDFANRLETHY